MTYTLQRQSANFWGLWTTSQIYWVLNKRPHCHLGSLLWNTSHLTYWMRKRWCHNKANEKNNEGWSANLLHRWEFQEGDWHRLLQLLPKWGWHHQVHCRGSSKPGRNHITATLTCYSCWSRAREQHFHHGFQEMLQQLNPRYQLPSRHYFMYTEIPNIYTETRDQYQKEKKLFMHTEQICGQAELQTHSCPLPCST